MGNLNLVLDESLYLVNGSTLTLWIPQVVVNMNVDDSIGTTLSLSLTCDFLYSDKNCLL